MQKKVVMLFSLFFFFFKSRFLLYINFFFDVQEQQLVPNSARLLKAIDLTLFSVQVPTWSSGSDSYCFLHYCSLLESGNIYFSVRFNGVNIVFV